METPATMSLDHLAQAAEAHRAPAHVVDLLLGVMRPFCAGPATGAAPTGTVAYARAARAEAQTYADRAWKEAYLAGLHTGATWGLAHNAQPIRVEVSAERLEELAQGVGG